MIFGKSETIQRNLKSDYGIKIPLWKVSSLVECEKDKRIKDILQGLRDGIKEKKSFIQKIFQFVGIKWKR